MAARALAHGRRLADAHHLARIVERAAREGAGERRERVRPAYCGVVGMSSIYRAPVRPIHDRNPGPCGRRAHARRPQGQGRALWGRRIQKATRPRPARPPCRRPSSSLVPSVEDEGVVRSGGWGCPEAWPAAVRGARQLPAFGPGLSFPVYQWFAVSINSSPYGKDLHTYPSFKLPCWFHGELRIINPGHGPWGQRRKRAGRGERRALRCAFRVAPPL